MSMAVANDIRLALPLMTPGGVVAFHDGGARYPGIGRAIGQLLGGRPGAVPIGMRHCLAAFVVEAVA